MSNYTAWIDSDEFPSLSEKNKPEPQKEAPQKDCTKKTNNHDDHIIRVYCSCLNKWVWRPVSQRKLTDYDEDYMMRVYNYALNKWVWCPVTQVDLDDYYYVPKR